MANLHRKQETVPGQRNLVHKQVPTQVPQDSGHPLRWIHAGARADDLCFLVLLLLSLSNFVLPPIQNPLPFVYAQRSGHIPISMLCVQFTNTSF